MTAGPTCEIQLVDPAGHETTAVIELADREWDEDGFGKSECRITLRWEGGEITGADWNYFAALCRVREQLEPLGLLPRCYGASRRVILSGMGADMGEGLTVYRIEVGRQVRRGDLVSIFATGPDVEPVSVAEQERFQQQWKRGL